MIPHLLDKIYSAPKKNKATVHPLIIFSCTTPQNTRKFCLRKGGVDPKQSRKIEFLRKKDFFLEVLLGREQLGANCLSFLSFYELASTMIFYDKEERDSLFQDCQQALYRFFYKYPGNFVGSWCYARKHKLAAVHEFLMFYFLTHPMYIKNLGIYDYDEFMEELEDGVSSKDPISIALMTIVYPPEHPQELDHCIEADKKRECLWTYAYLKRLSHARSQKDYFETLGKSSKELYLLGNLMMAYTFIESALMDESKHREDEKKYDVIGVYLTKPLQAKVPMAEYLLGIALYYGIGAKANKVQGKLWLNKALIDDSQKESFWNYFKTLVD